MTMDEEGVEEEEEEVEGSRRWYHYVIYCLVIREGTGKVLRK